MGSFNITLAWFHQLCGNNTSKPSCVMLLQDKGWRRIVWMSYQIQDTSWALCIPFLYFFSCLLYLARWYGFPCINYFQDLSTSSCIEAADGSCGSDIVLSPGVSTDVFDVSRTPITDFHYQERHQQGKLAKVSAAWGCNTILDHLAVLFSCCLPVLSSWVVFLPLALTSTQQHLDRNGASGWFPVCIFKF